MSEDDKKPFKFTVIGMPENEDIEVADEKPERPSRGMRRGMPSPKELDEMIGRLTKGDCSEDEMMEMIQKLGVPKEMFDNMMKDLSNSLGIKYDDPWGSDNEESDEDDEDTENDTEQNSFNYKLGNIKHLFNTNTFQQIKIVSDPNLYVDFIEKYGSGPFTVDMLADEDLAWLSSLPVPVIGKIEDFSIVEYNNNYILLYGKPYDRTEQGVFIAVTLSPEGDYQVVVPEYGNTYDMVADDENREWAEDDRYVENPEICRLYNSSNDSVFDRTGKFVFLDLDKIRAGLTLLLTPDEHPLMSVRKFGTIIQMKTTNTSGYSNKLKIGMIKPNDSQEARLFKKDYDIPEDKEYFEFYIKFKDPVSEETLDKLSELIQKVDLSETLLYDNYELKAKYRGEVLYIEMDLGTIGANLMRWLDDKGNSTF